VAVITDNILVVEGCYFLSRKGENWYGL